MTEKESKCRPGSVGEEEHEDGEGEDHRQADLPPLLRDPPLHALPHLHP